MKVSSSNQRGLMLAPTARPSGKSMRTQNIRALNSPASALLRQGPTQSPGYAAQWTSLRTGSRSLSRTVMRSMHSTSDQALWLSSVSTHTELNHALDECIEKLSPQFEKAGSSPELAIVFFTANYKDRFHQVAPWLKSKLPSLKCVVGSTGSGVIGMGSESPVEIERKPAFSLTLASLVDTEVGVFVADTEKMPDLDGPVEPWVKMTGIRDPSAAPVSFVLLSDPFFQGLDSLLSGLDYAFPSSVKVGGLSSAAFSSERRALICSTFDGTDADSPNEFGPDAQRGQCCVGLWMQGACQIQPLIAQGCRAFNEEIFVVHEGRGNQIHELEDPSGEIQVPFEWIRRLILGLEDDGERSLVSRNLMVAIAPDDFKETKDLGQGDFLVRPLLGGDRTTGSMAIGDFVRKGMRIKFVIRDREGALSDMEQHAVEYKRGELMRAMGGGEAPSSSSAQASGGAKPGSAAPPLNAVPKDSQAIGTLIFSCNGRGSGLFGEDNVDSNKVHGFIPVPSAGFFCNGEIGPVGGSTFLHGFTCSVGVIRAPKSKVPGSSEKSQ